MKKGLLILSLLVVYAYATSAWAQTRTVTGTVTDEDNNQSLPGVNVVLKGTSVGTVTDVDGQYQISVPQDGGALVFSFIGLESKEVAIGNRSVVDVALSSDVKQLNEVVVTALGIERESKGLGYSVDNLSAEDVNQAQQTNVINALSGKAAGVFVSSGSGNMAGSSRILIRGANSVTGNNQPLFVVDGIPMDNSNINSIDAARGGGGIDWGSPAQDINPDDVENISILKGPQAAALYGSRASNGVIMITTKKGKNAGAMNISVNTGVSFESVSLIPQLQRRYGGGYGLNKLGYSDGSGYYKVPYDVTDDDGNVTESYQSFDLVPDYAVDESHGPAYSTTAGEYLTELGGTQYADQPLMYRAWNSWDEWDTDNFGKSIPWQAPANDVEDYFDTGVAFNTNIALSGGSEVANYRLSYTNLTSNGYFPNSEFDRNTLNMSGNMKLGPKLSANGILNYVNATAYGRPITGYDDNNVMQKFVQWGQRQLDMGRLREYKNPDGSQRTWNRRSYYDPTPKYSDNPYWTAFENFTEDVRNRFYGTVGLTYDFTEYLHLSGNIRGDNYTWRTEDRVAIGSQAQSSYTEGVRTFQEMNYELMLRFDKQLNQDFGINAFVGTNAMHQLYNRNSTTTDGGLVLPNLYTVENSANTAIPDDYKEEKKINSVFGNIGLSWRDMIFVDGTIRNDWSSTLPEGNNSYLYPSVSGSFVFTELPALSGQSVLSFGKLRGGWAEVGNDTDPYRTLETYTNYAPNFGIPRYSVPNTMANEDLRPERTRSWEIGAVLGFLNDRINLDFTYYDMKTYDLITSISISGASGYLFRNVNAGVMTNKGIELGINGTIIDTDDLEWNVGVNFARNRNKLIELYADVDNYRLVNGPFSVSVNAFKGEPYGQIMGTDYLRDQDGDIVVRQTGAYAGAPMATDAQVPLGTVLPDYNMGISSGVSFKGITLNGLIDIQKGGHYFSTSHMWGTYSGMFDATAEEGYREEGPLFPGVIGDIESTNEDGTVVLNNKRENDINADYLYYGLWHYYGPAALNVFEADYVKLRELKLAYLLPSGLTGPFKNVEVSLWGRNLFIWGLDNPNFDPETVVTNSGNIQGIEGAALPSTRTYGLNIQFNL
ncbi:MAG: SusC/RagA family TonB-linked outer membrane protein [Candidatus Cyclobacteriaceae bacterium M3_2C_046]